MKIFTLGGLDDILGVGFGGLDDVLGVGGGGLDDILGVGPQDIPAILVVRLGFGIAFRHFHHRVFGSFDTYKLSYSYIYT